MRVDIELSKIRESVLKAVRKGEKSRVNGRMIEIKTSECSYVLIDSNSIEIDAYSDDISGVIVKCSSKYTQSLIEDIKREECIREASLIEEEIEYLKGRIEHQWKIVDRNSEILKVVEYIIDDDVPKLSNDEEYMTDLLDERKVKLNEVIEEAMYIIYDDKDKIERLESQLEALNEA